MGMRDDPNGSEAKAMIGERYVDRLLREARERKLAIEQTEERLKRLKEKERKSMTKEQWNPFKGMSGAGIFSCFVLGMIFFVSSFFMWGWLIKNLWAWFLVPLGVPAIGLAHAIGLRYLVSAFTYKHTGNADEGKSMREILTGSCARSIIVPIAGYYIGMFIHSFM